jgi:hypothetical protein
VEVGVQVDGGGVAVMYSAVVASRGSVPSAIARVRSRSVRMPANWPATMTTTDPTCSLCIRSAASASRSSPSTLTTQGRKIDLTFILPHLIWTCVLLCRQR